MNLSGISVIDLDGAYDDGWCAQLVRARVRAERSGSTLSVTVWVPAHEIENTSFTVKLDDGAAKLFTTRNEILSKFEQPVTISVGDEISFQIFCGYRVSTSGGDERELSFQLSEVCLS